MNATEKAKAIEVVLAMAERAAAAVSAVYTTDFAVDYKSPADPVTNADREANAIIVEALHHHFPGVPVVAEESDPSLYAKWRESTACWFVDPLDGTRDFVEKNGQFAVMIGLAEEGKASLGVVLCPALGRRFAGAPDLGSFEIAADGSRKKIDVSSTQSAKGGTMLVSRSRPNSTLDGVAASLGITTARVGSAGLKGIKVACAEADAYAHLGQAGYLWDGCAPEAIVQGAGGRVTDVHGNAIDYRQPMLGNERGMLMTNGNLHDEILAAIAVARS
ncbi:MAG TPA: inositol monophosphatase family protein [Polyangiaceae bacterium]